MAYISAAQQAELRHQIAAIIDKNITAPIEGILTADTNNAAAYVARRKATLIVAGEPSATGAALPTDDVFFNWITSGGAKIPDAQLPDVILQLVNEFVNRTGLNQNP